MAPCLPQGLFEGNRPDLPWWLTLARPPPSCSCCWRWWWVSLNPTKPVSPVTPVSLSPITLPLPSRWSSGPSCYSTGTSVLLSGVETRLASWRVGEVGEIEQWRSVTVSSSEYPTSLIGTFYYKDFTIKTTGRLQLPFADRRLSRGFSRSFDALTRSVPRCFPPNVTRNR